MGRNQPGRGSTKNQRGSSSTRGNAQNNNKKNQPIHKQQKKGGSAQRGQRPKDKPVSKNNAKPKPSEAPVPEPAPVNKNMAKLASINKLMASSATTKPSQNSSEQKPISSEKRLETSKPTKPTMVQVNAVLQSLKSLDKVLENYEVEMNPADQLSGLVEFIMSREEKLTENKG